MKKLILYLLVCSIIAGCDNLNKQEPTAQQPKLKPQEPQKVELSPEKRLEQSIKCAEEGRKFFDRYKQDNNSPEIVWYNPEYHYNRKMNAYLIFINYMWQGSDGELFQEYYVIDILSNKALMSSVIRTKGGVKQEMPHQGNHYSEAEKNRLFSE